MNTETQRVDVLAVMWRDAADAAQYRKMFMAETNVPERLKQSDEARYAMAELIEANLEMDAATVACVAASRAEDKTALSEAGLRHYEANKRRVAALARIGGS